MALAKAARDLELVAASQGRAKRLHKDLLAAFAEHGKEATVVESLQFFGRLQKARSTIVAQSVSTPGADTQLLRRWEADLRSHRGFQALWQRFFVVEQLQELSSADLSRAYNQLQRLGLQQEAGEVWPLVTKRIADGKMAEVHALIGVWSSAPVEHLLEVDAALDSVLRGADQQVYIYRSALGRAPDWPSSKAAITSALALGRRTQDIASPDLVTVALSTQGAIETQKTAGTAPKDAFVKLQRSVRQELLSREGKLESVPLFALLRVCSGTEDELWPLLRKQLLTEQSLTVAQAIQVAKIVTSMGERTPSKADGPLFYHTMGSLRERLRKPDAGYVGYVSRHLEHVVFSEVVCYAVLNGAVRLRKDLYPAVVWLLFIKCAEVGLITRHPKLQVRMPELGKILASHDVRDAKMPLTQMVKAAEAMRINKAPIDASLRQMCKHFVNMYKEMIESQAPEDGAAEGDLRGDTQRLMLRFWVQLTQLGEKDDGLLEMLRSFCSSDGACKLEERDLLESIVELQGIGNADASELAKGLSQQFRTSVLPRTSLGSLVEAARKTSMMDMRQDIVLEVGRRIEQEELPASPGDVVDQLTSLVGCVASWPPLASNEAPVDLQPPEIVQDMLHEVGRAFPQAMQEAAALGKDRARSRLSAVVSMCATCNAAADAETEAALRKALQALLSKQQASRPAWAVELAFHVAAFYGGRLPFETALLTWQMLTRDVLTGSHAADILGGPAVEAQLLAVGTAARQLASSATLAALRLMHGADRLEVMLDQLAAQPSSRFHNSEHPAVADRLQLLHSELAENLGGMPIEERFLVPGTPYVVDIALERAKRLYMVPRPEFVNPAGQGLSGFGLLFENTVTAMGWQLEWAWPEEWLRPAAEGDDPPPVAEVVLATSVEADSTDTAVAAPEVATGAPRDVAAEVVADKAAVAAVSPQQPESSPGSTPLGTANASESAKGGAPQSGASPADARASSEASDVAADAAATKAGSK